MSEDKMREEFNPYVLFGYPFGTREAIAAVNGFDEGVKACAAIKDAEIAELTREAVNAKDYMVRLSKTVTEQGMEIASRDLMIKELRLEATDYIHAVGVLFSVQPEGDCLAERKPSKDIHTYNAFIYLSTQGKRLHEALANSEHHDSRALEKMLLEAELNALKQAAEMCIPYDQEFRHMITNRQAKLAELNKE